MNPRAAIDFVNEANELQKHKVSITLLPDALLSSDFVIPNLVWDFVPYGRTHIATVPNDKRGVYAFAVHQPSTVLPPNCYILYIGMAGLNSNRSLRARYSDYLTESKYMKRPKIARMIGTWHSVLKFFFVPVDDAVSSSDIKTLEYQLLNAIVPPLSPGDLDAGLRRQENAFK